MFPLEAAGSRFILAASTADENTSRIDSTVYVDTSSQAVANSTTADAFTGEDAASIALSFSPRLGSAYSFNSESSRSSARSAPSVATTVSSRGAQLFNLQRPALPDFAAPLLPCEFFDDGGCLRTFAPHREEEEWIRHTVSAHLSGEFPSACLCWYCDSSAFFSSSDSPEDREANFRARMQHIAQHFWEGMTLLSKKPDIFMLRHLRDSHLLSEVVFQAKKQHANTVRPQWRYASAAGSHAARSRLCEMQVATSRKRRGSGKALFC